MVCGIENWVEEYPACVVGHTWVEFGREDRDGVPFPRRTGKGELEG